MTQIKTYILQKDLPDAKAGDKYRQNHFGSYNNTEKDTTVWDSELVENNPEWFLPEEEPMYTKTDLILHIKAAFDAGRSYYGKLNYEHKDSDYYISTIKL